MHYRLCKIMLTFSQGFHEIMFVVNKPLCISVFWVCGRIPGEAYRGPPVLPPDDRGAWPVSWPKHADELPQRPHSPAVGQNRVLWRSAQIPQHGHMYNAERDQRGSGYVLLTGEHDVTLWRASTPRSRVRMSPLPAPSESPRTCSSAHHAPSTTPTTPGFRLHCIDGTVQVDLILCNEPNTPFLSRIRKNIIGIVFTCSDQ